jgi:predicted ATPase
MHFPTNKALRFTSIQVENWRNFGKIDVPLQRRAFIVGPNASGKSNFLDLFRFLHDIVSVGRGFELAIQSRGGVSGLRSLFARRYSDIHISVNIGTDEHPSIWQYELRFNQDNLQRPVIRGEKVMLDSAVLVERPNESDKSDPERLTQTYLQQVNVNKEYREVAEFFTSVRYLHIVPQLVREPDRSVGRKDDPYGGDFLEQIARTPEKTQTSRLRRIEDALRVAVPQLEALELNRDPVKGTPHLRGKYQHWRPQGAWQTEEQFSDGTLRLLGLLWATLDGSGPLLLEEPELSLHPEVIRYIPQMFARIQRRSGRQIIATTHSTELLREGVGLNEVVLLEPSQEGTSARVAGEFADVRELLEGGINIADIVMPRTRPAQAEQLSFFADE